MQRAAVIAMLGVLAFLVPFSNAVRAGTLPDISGTWYANGDPSKRCEISQSGSTVRLRNDEGGKATGTFTDPSTLDTNWGYAGGHHITGTISFNLRRISWSNGTYWTRASAPEPMPTENPYRALRFATESLSPARGPIEVFGGWGAVRRDGRGVVVCVSFKNVRPVTATRVVIDFPLANRQGETIDTLHLERRGEFSSGVEINGWGGLDSWQSQMGHRGYADNCVVRNSGIAAMSLMNAQAVTYRIVRVDFSDGSVWPRETEH